MGLLSGLLVLILAVGCGGSNTEEIGKLDKDSVKDLTPEQFLALAKDRAKKAKELTPKVVKAGSERDAPKSVLAPLIPEIKGVAEDIGVLSDAAKTITGAAKKVTDAITQTLDEGNKDAAVTQVLALVPVEEIPESQQFEVAEVLDTVKELEEKIKLAEEEAASDLVCYLPNSDGEPDDAIEKRTIEAAELVASVVEEGNVIEEALGVAVSEPEFDENLAEWFAETFATCPSTENDIQTIEDVTVDVLENIIKDITPGVAWSIVQKEINVLVNNEDKREAYIVKLATDEKIDESVAEKLVDLIGLFADDNKSSHLKYSILLRSLAIAKISKTQIINIFKSMGGQHVDVAISGGDGKIAYDKFIADMAKEKVK